MRLPPLKYRLLAAGWALIVVLYVFADFTIYGAERMTTLGGDGIKNYFTYLHQVIYSRGMQFTGMNYPFGEHCFYTDGQPLLSLPLQFIHQHIHPLTGPQALGIMHWSIALSYAAGIYFLFRLLYALEVKALPAIAFGTLIMFLSPQALKCPAHFALSNGAYIPGLLYGTLAWERTRGKKYICWLWLLGLMMCLHHLYFAALLLMWLGLCGMGHLLFSGEPQRRRLIFVAGLAVPVLASVIPVQLFIRMTDPVRDRPVMPSFGYDMFTTWPDVLTSNKSPIWEGMQRAGLIDHPAPLSEGTAYPGIIVCLLAVAALVYFVIRRKEGLRRLLAPVPPAWLWVTAGFAVIGSGVLVTFGHDWLLRHVGMVRQFRSLGRFSWCFYYLICVMTVAWLHKYFIARYWPARKALVLAVMVPLLAIWTIDANGYILFLKSPFQPGGDNAGVFFRRINGWTGFLAGNGYRAGDFQCIVTIPYIHVGSEKIKSDEWEADWGLSLAIIAAQETGLPLMDVKLARTSWSQTFEQMKTFGGPFAGKPVLRRFPDDRPVLALQLEQLALNPDEQFIAGQGRLLGAFDGCRVYAVRPSAVLAAQRQMTDSVQRIITQMKAADSCIGCDGPWFRTSFEEHKPALHFRGHGAWQEHDTVRQLTVYTLPRPAEDSLYYACAAWIHITRRTAECPTISIACTDTQGKVLAEGLAFGAKATDSAPGWLLAGSYFHLPPGTVRVSIKLLNNDPQERYTLDELELRPAGGLLISRQPDKILVNDHLFYPQGHLIP